MTATSTVQVGDTLQYENLHGAVNVATVVAINDNGSFYVKWDDGFNDHNNTWTRDEFVYPEDN